MAKGPTRSVRNHIGHGKIVDPVKWHTTFEVIDCSKRDVEIIHVIPFGRHESRLVKTTYTWPCVGCKSPILISKTTLNYLKSGSIVALRCADCLPPPDESGLNAVKPNLRRTA